MLPQLHRSFLDRALPILKRDARIVGVAGAGSLLSGTMDEFSDLDLIVVGDGKSFPSLMAERMTIAASLGKLLSGFTGEHVGEPRLLICLYDDPLLHVDLKFVALDDMQRRIEDPIILFERGSELSSTIRSSKARHPMPDRQWIEDRFWVWIHYAALRLGRGELFEVLDFLAFMRGTVFGPLSLVAAGQLPRGVRRLESFVPKDAQALKATVAQHDKASCVAAITATIAQYRAIRRSPGWESVELKDAAEEAATKYFAAIRDRSS